MLTLRTGWIGGWIASAVACIALATGCARKQAGPEMRAVAPAESSAMCKLFLKADAASEAMYRQVMEMKREHGHRLHVLCFLAEPDPDPTTKAEMARTGVKQVPSAVFDDYWVVSEASADALGRALEACLKKEPPSLSMELHAGVVANRDLCVAFLFCNHIPKLDFEGSLTVYGYENGVQLGSWRCDYLFRKPLGSDNKVRLASGLCQQPMLATWTLPKAMPRSKAGAVALVHDRKHRLLDSICSDKRCTRTGVCR